MIHNNLSVNSSVCKTEKRCMGDIFYYCDGNVKIFCEVMGYFLSEANKKKEKLNAEARTLDEWTN